MVYEPLYDALYVSFLYSGGVNKTIIPLALVGYEMMDSQRALVE